jgi:hypothetical protein
MTPSTKKFSHNDYTISDPLSKQHAVEFFTQTDSNFNLDTPLLEQQEMFKQGDFTIMYGNKSILVETEQKRVWTALDGSFPYNTIDVPTRKWQSKANLYVMFNLSFDVLALTEMKNILNAEIITKATHRSNGEYITQGETFFRVPTDMFRFYVKSMGVWRNVRS